MENIKYKHCNNCRNKENKDEIFLYPDSWEIEKAETEPLEGQEKPVEKYIIKGYASIPVKDREDEIVLKDGIIFDDFLNYGYFNYDHLHLPQFILGKPTEARLDKKGFYTEGVLFNTPLVKDLYNLYNSCKKAGINNLLGMSIEGKVLERDSYNPDIIKKVHVRYVAISPKVVNYDTTKSFEILSKSILSKPEPIRNIEVKNTENNDNLNKADVILHQDPRGQQAGVNPPLSTESVEKEVKKIDTVSFIDLEIPSQGKLPVKIRNQEDLNNFAYLYLRIKKGFTHEQALKTLNKIKIQKI